MLVASKAGGWSTHQTNTYDQKSWAAGAEKPGMKRRSSVPWYGSSGAKSGGNGKVSCFQPLGMGQRALGSGVAAFGGSAERASRAKAQPRSRNKARRDTVRL